MGSRSPLPRKPPQGELKEREILGCPTREEGSATRLLVERIASALHVSPAVLYNPPSAVAPTRGADNGDRPSASLDRECEALLYAYRRIRDPKERQRLLALVDEAAERT
jgi:hypothetical protein